MRKPATIRRVDNGELLGWHCICLASAFQRMNERYHYTLGPDDRCPYCDCSYQQIEGVTGES